jgi:hypothetical protein
VQTPEEQQLFSQLLPQHRNGASSSKVKLNSPRQVNFEQMAADWNDRVRADMKSTGSGKYTFKHPKHLKDYFMSDARAQVAADALQAVQQQAAAQASQASGVGVEGNSQSLAAAATGGVPAVGTSAGIGGTPLAAASNGGLGTAQSGSDAVPGSSSAGLVNRASSTAAAAAAAAAEAGSSSGVTPGGLYTALGDASAVGSLGSNAAPAAAVAGGLAGAAAGRTTASSSKPAGAQKGVGYGGKGGKKTCVYCTVAKFGAMTPDAARSHAQAVGNTAGHRTTCPYCKCDKSLASRKSVLTQEELKLKDNCAACRTAAKK